MLKRALKSAKEVAKLQQALEQTNHMLKVLHWGKRKTVFGTQGEIQNSTPEEFHHSKA